jgi:phage I-like protein
MMKAKATDAGNESLEQTALQSASLVGHGVPRRVRVAPWGTVESSNGSFVVDEESAACAVGAFEKHGTDLPIDYEHQTLGGTYASPSGRAPAAGWIKRLMAEPGAGLMADIEWTAQAVELLASKQYRYLSPVAMIRRTDRKLMAIHSAALTNKPAIVGMQPLVNSLLVECDGIEATPLAALRAELNLDEDIEPTEVLVAASRRLVELREADARRRVERRIGEAIAAGKLVEAQRAWAEELVAREEALFDHWLATAPVVVQRGMILAPASLGADAQRERLAATRAKAEFRGNRLLSGITSEEAYVRNASREAELGAA